jgi:hypothetical protein
MRTYVFTVFFAVLSVVVLLGGVRAVLRTGPDGA